MKTKIVLWILILGLFSAISTSVSALQILDDHYPDVSPYTPSSANEKKGFGYKFELNNWVTDEMILKNVTSKTATTTVTFSPQICLFNSSNKDIIKCVANTINGANSNATSADFDITLVPGNEYILINHNNNSDHQVYYKANCCSHPVNGTPHTLIQWNRGQYVTNPGSWDVWTDYNTAWWTTMLEIRLENQSVAGGGGGGDYVTLSFGSNITTNSTIYYNVTCLGNCTGNYTFLLDNVTKTTTTDNFYTYIGLTNYTEYNLYVNYTFQDLWNYTNITLFTQQTEQFNMVLWTYNRVVEYQEEIEMLALYVLYLGLFGIAYWLLKTGNMFVGIIFLLQSIGLDFYIVQDFYTEYIATNNVASGWTYAFIGFAGFFILSSFVFKIFMPFYLRKPKGG